MRSFELICVRIQDNLGNEGLGYTYTVGSGGVAIKKIIDIDLKPILINEEENLIEKIWKKMWWHLHYVGRGGRALRWATTGNELRLRAMSWTKPKTLHLSSTWSTCSSNILISNAKVCNRCVTDI